MLLEQTKVPGRTRPEQEAERQPLTAGRQAFEAMTHTADLRTKLSQLGFTVAMTTKQSGSGSADTPIFAVPTLCGATDGPSSTQVAADLRAG